MHLIIDKAPPCPGRGVVGLCIDRCIMIFIYKIKITNNDIMKAPLVLMPKLHNIKLLS